MNAKGERSRSVWMDVEVAPDAAPLESDHSADVAVVGAGIAGLSIAYELTLRGLSVVVLDRDEIAGGMTSRTAAHLAPICDDSLADLLSMRGRDLAKAFQASQNAAVDRIEAIQSELGIDCEFRRLDGILFLDPASDESVLDDEVAAANEIGVTVEREKGLPLRTLEDRPLLRYSAQATFHPLKYLRGIAKALTDKGARLHPDTAARPWQGRGLPDRGRRRHRKVGRVHSPRLSSALELVRDVLGLPLPRLLFRAGRDRAQRSGDRSARRCRNDGCRRRPMIHHVSLATNDVARSRRFYDRVMGVLGSRLLKASEESADYGISAVIFSLETPVDGKPASAGNGVHVAFDAAAVTRSPNSIGSPCSMAERMRERPDCGANTTPITTAPSSSTPTATRSRQSPITGNETGRRR
ncbi:hypothetical protein ASE63_25075 [Bosea sp. Root381]|nr:hypothetical protein ASE63_25075 [Bosea sp. Root381]